MQPEDELVTLRAGDARVLLGMFDPEDWGVVPPELEELIARVRTRLDTGRRPADEPVEAEVVPMPPGRWGRVEMPGFRNHTGWLNEELRFGVQMVIVRDWDGGEIAAVAIGPACRVLYLPAPLNRPGASAPERAALPAGGRDDADYVWDGDPDPEAAF